ncbi:MAG: hypothetical protein ABI954_07035 [Pyrinomonadaceae bacterium]
MKRQIIDANLSYTFSDYFKINADAEEVLAYFNLLFEVEKLDLPQTQKEIERLDNLSLRLEENLAMVNLNNEIARREFLIAPVLSEVAHFTNGKIKVEYPIEVSQQLRGTLDYLLKANNNFLVVEAKQADLTRGFTQLAVELVAFSEWEDKDVLFGAVSIGESWRFGKFERQRKIITQDLNIYNIPADLEKLMRILIGILE